MDLRRYFKGRFTNKRRLVYDIIIVAVITIMVIAVIRLLPYLIIEIPPERSEWAYKAVQVTKLNDQGFYGEGVTIGLIDTGIDLTHPELKSVNLVAWRDVINGEPEPYDDHAHQHGTAMAGILVGKEYGIAPKADLIVVKALAGSGGATESNIYSAIRYCINHDADIISMSLGGIEYRIDDLTGPWQDSQLEQVCEEAVSKGIFLVAAAGNDGGENDDGEVDVPGVYDKLITVGAVKKSLKIADLSSEGSNDGRFPNIIHNWDPWERHDPHKKPEVVAPGIKIRAPGPEGKYYEMDGTSLAVPFVSGGLALILGELTEYQHENNAGEADITKVKDDITTTSRKLANQEQPHDDRYGYGLFQAFDLYEELSED